MYILNSVFIRLCKRLFILLRYEEPQDWNLKCFKFTKWIVLIPEDEYRWKVREHEFYVPVKAISGIKNCS
jgi:hypothetical protein